MNDPNYDTREAYDESVALAKVAELDLAISCLVIARDWLLDRLNDEEAILALAGVDFRHLGLDYWANEVMNFPGGSDD